MSTETMLLQVPVRLYTDLTALAAAEQTDLVSVLTRLVVSAHRQNSTMPSPALRHLLDQTTNSPESPAMIIETMRRSLRLSIGQWERLHQDLPPTVELSQAIGQCLSPTAHLSAEIVAMREA